MTPSYIKSAYLALLVVMLAANVVPFPYYIHMIITATLVVYIGSYQSVAAAAGDASTASGSQMEKMSSKDAYMFPVFGSIFLFSLYLVFKFLPKEYVNLAVKGYFFLFGIFILASNLHKLCRLFLPEVTFERLDKEWFRCKIPFVSPDSAEKDKSAQPKKVKVAPVSNATTTSASSAEAKPSDGRTVFSQLDVMCYIGAIIFGFWYLLHNHWMANNIFGIFFSVQGIEFLSLGSYFNGVILLCGLFVYDVFWVFGTDVMVTVAKSFDAPIKLLFPRSIDGSMPPSMLGLGDIVIPGIFVALLLRFDNTVSKPLRPFHFTWVLLGYVLGLVATVACMIYFSAAQPALLYLVPSCLGSSLLAGALSGHFGSMLKFNEHEKDETHENAESQLNGRTDASAEPDGTISQAPSTTTLSEAVSVEDVTPLTSEPSKLRRSRSKKMD